MAAPNKESQQNRSALKIPTIQNIQIMWCYGVSSIANMGLHDAALLADSQTTTWIINCDDIKPVKAIPKWYRRGFKMMSS